MGAPEPWLAGRFAELAPVPRLLCCSLELSLMDLEKWIKPLSNQQIWATTAAGSSVGFQLRHIAGSVDRLLTYARKQALSEPQLAAMRTENEPGGEGAELLAALREAYEQAASFAFQVRSPELDEPRYIGRKRMETPLGVLLAHMAEHTQRHTGQAIILAKLAKS